MRNKRNGVISHSFSVFSLIIELFLIAPFPVLSSLYSIFFSCHMLLFFCSLPFNTICYVHVFLILRLSPCAFPLSSLFCSTPVPGLFHSGGQFFPLKFPVLFTVVERTACLFDYPLFSSFRKDDSPLRGRW